MSSLPGAVLFACSMNAVRSPMASGLFKSMVQNKVYVKSAGVRPGSADHFAIEVMNEIGIDISAHVPRAIVDLQDTSFDFIITLTPEAHHQALEFTRTMAVEVEYWPTLDPSLTTGSRDQILSAYRSCRDSLAQKIAARFPV
ncbi:MAG: low molecular weight phosphatase family protein [Methyloligellaceae bacterium]